MAVRFTDVARAMGLAQVVVGCSSSGPVAPGPKVLARSEVVPAGYVSLGGVQALCRRRQAHWEGFEGVQAKNLFCDQASLMRALEEKGRELGGTVLAGERCKEVAGQLVCEAVVARPSEGTGVHESAEPSDSDALSPKLAGRILIDLAPAVPKYARTPRSGAEVQEFAALPVGQRELGLMRAHCRSSACTPEQAQAGLRAAAGGLGVPSLVGVRCTNVEGDVTCVATLAATERDPETDPNAH